MGQKGDRDGVFIGSEFNEINTSIAKTFRDLGPKEKEAVPERSGVLKPELPTNIEERGACVNAVWLYN